MPLISCFTFTPGLSTHQPGWCWLWPRLGPRACRHRYTWSNGTDDGNHPIEAHGGFSELKSTLTLGLSIYIKKKNYLHGFHGIQHYICCLYLVSLVLHTYIYISIVVFPRNPWYEIPCPNTETLRLYGWSCKKLGVSVFTFSDGITGALGQHQTSIFP